MRSKMRHLTFCSIVVICVIGISMIAMAKVQGVCSDCHTMHNSQNGSSVATDSQGNFVSSTYAYLLKTTCVGCHTGTNVPGETTPKVYNQAGPLYNGNTLAGGDFYWVLQDSAKGHNCLSIPSMSADSNLTQAPGWHGSGSPVNCGVCHKAHHIYPEGAHGDCSSCHERVSSCKSCHNPAHHADDSGPVVGKSGGWYRFLIASNHPEDDLGVKGIEDDDWELTVSSSDHNEYNGSSDPSGGPDNSMSHFCAGCHGYFHGIVQSANDDGHSPWLRHPTNIPLPNSGEFSSYTVYSPMAPVARDPGLLIGMSGPISSVSPGSDQVMCLSCHRAHGSPYPDALRWDYLSNCWANNPNSGCGCFVCHTQKD